MNVDIDTLLGLAAEGRLTAWEIEFVEDISERDPEWLLTDAQEAKLDEIYARYCK